MAATLAFVILTGLAVAALVARVKPLSAPAPGSNPAPDAPAQDWVGLDLGVIIPARNEAGSLPLLLADLANQSLPPAEIIVIDDESTDDTAALAHAGGARVVSAAGREPGWNPKVWALTVGSRHATAPVLIFFDADVRLAPTALAALGASLNSGLLSAAPFHRTETRVEAFSALGNVMMVAGGGPGLARHAQGAVGSCVEIRGDDYAAIGGHAAQPATIVDDLALAANARQSGLATTLWRGDELVAVRSYPGGFGDLARGWTKNLAAGMRYANPMVSLILSAWLAATVLPAWLLITGEWRLAAATYLAVAVQTWGLTRLVGRFDPLMVTLGAPLLGLFMTGATVVSLWRAIAGRPTVWKDRSLLANGLEQA